MQSLLLAGHATARLAETLSLFNVFANTLFVVISSTNTIWKKKSVLGRRWKLRQTTKFLKVMYEIGH